LKKKERGTSEALMKPMRSLLLALALTPAILALIVAFALASPFAGAALSSLAVAARSPWLWLAALTAGTLVRRPICAVLMGLIVAGVSISLLPAHDRSGFTGPLLLDIARIDIAVIAALIGQAIRSIIDHRRGGMVIRPAPLRR
jgi:hypothetical protein